MNSRLNERIAKGQFKPKIEETRSDRRRRREHVPTVGSNKRMKRQDPTEEGERLESVHKVR
jgi:hypothetical protein